MTQPPIIFREFVHDQHGVRCDFYSKDGPIVQSYCSYVSTSLSIDFTMLGYVIEDFPSLEHMDENKE